MADIAAIFHWPPGVMEAMAILDLAEWREQARRRVPGDDDE